MSAGEENKGLIVTSEEKKGLRAKLAKVAVLTRHDLQAVFGSSLWLWVLSFVAEFATVMVGNIIINPPKGGLLALVWVVVKLVPKLWKGSTPTAIKELERTTKKRSFAIAQLTLDLTRFPRMTFDEVKGFQHRVLEQVANYVRDLRGDTRGSSIFANLLVEKDPEWLEVVGRSDSRALYGLIPKATSVAWRALQSGEKERCGDLYAEYPTTTPGKKYCSVLAIPVIDHEGSIVGVVTIDSKQKHHFDAIDEDILLLVMPLLAMLGWTVSRTNMKSQVENAVAEGSQVES